MTDKAVSALTSLTGANTATGDLLYIVDISEAAAADRSKKITAQELQNYLKAFPATIGVGGATPAASGAGISFPATLSASSDANTLDDYEEGSWTPTITNASGYTVQLGRYTKIGNLVYVVANISSTFTNTGGVAQKIGGFPFVIENVSSLFATGVIFPVQGFNPASMAIVTQGAPNATQVQLYSVSASTGNNYTVLVDTAFGTTVEFEFSMVYRAA